MSIRVMTAVWGIDLPDSQKIVLLALADCANDEGLCWPSMASLAGKCSKGERTVQGVIKELVAAGHLTRTEVVGKGCKYVVHPRSDCAPQKLHPRKDRTPPPQPLRDTPAAAAPKPSKNHQEPSEVSASGDAPLTVEEVVEGWNDTAAKHGLVQVRKLTADRRKKAQAQIRRFDLEEWQAVFAKVSQSPFLKGSNDRGWRCDFDFILSEKNFVKILEGKYDRQPTDTRR